MWRGWRGQKYYSFKIYIQKQIPGIFAEFLFYGRRLKSNSEVALEMGDNEKRLGNTEHSPIN